MTPQEIDRIECAIRHIESSLDVDPWAMEIAVEAMKTQLSAEGTTSDLISRQAAIDILNQYALSLNPDKDSKELWKVKSIKSFIERLPSVQPEPLSDAYMKTVWTWLLDYQIKAAELKGRYTPYEVLSWVANDWRKEHERSDRTSGGD